MKAFLRHALLSLAVAVVCQTGLALAEDDYPPLSGESEAARAAGEQKAAARAPSPWCIEDSKCAEKCPPDTGWEHCLCTALGESCPVWTIDYRIRSMFDSHTSYEFGTPVPAPDGWAPLSRLDWSLDSTWHGLQVGLQKPNWRVYLEWLTPMRRNIEGPMADFDWLTPTEPDHLDSLSHSSLRWNEGQMLEAGGEIILTEHIFSLPIEVWPAAGFRFQRFDITGHDAVQIVSDTPFTPPVGTVIPGDVITFNQQFYMGYVGGQLRSTLQLDELTTIQLKFQGDWGGTWGYNVDHHISGYEAAGIHRYTMESTSGGALHLAFIAEAPMSKHFSVGLQVDHMEIRTTGTHHFLMYGAESADLTWDNGVSVTSDQTSFTAFVRACF